MSISYDITTDVRFKQGIEQGAAIKSIIAIRNILKEKIITDSKKIALILDISIPFVESTKEALKQEVAITKALSVKRARVDTVAKKYKVSKLFVKALRELLKKKDK